MFEQEAFNAWKTRHKCVGKIGKGRLPYNHEQRYAVSDNRIAFVRFVSNALIVSYRDPTARTHSLQPDFVWSFGSEMLHVPLDIETACAENLSKALTEIAVGKVNMAQAARS